ncbi:hypothetical protein AGMMS49944_10470 [Spirochaetia bacterium]|nr:hypothetical protein AGMMS49944_10470 [Spirochaetia bacterium]
MKTLIGNLPDIQNEAERNILLSRISTAVNDMLSLRYHIEKPGTTIQEQKAEKKSPDTSAKPAAKEAENKEENTTITLQDPQFSFDQLVLEDKIIDELQYSIKFEMVRDLVYETWGLKKIEPSPKLALNFHGDSGTGKTMAAHALAKVMGKKIILASYAEIESKYHGDGPKNVKKLFQFAIDNDAVLFIDEADSLLSKRLTNVTQGSEQAINSMRSQLLIEIEKFSGIVIFATNLAENYDGAFKTRIRSIKFKKPDKELRHKLWEKMLLETLPLSIDVDVEKLSEIEDICGRDIKNAIVKAAIVTAINEGQTGTIAHKMLETAINDIILSNKEMGHTQKGTPLSEEEKKDVAEKIKGKLKEQKEEEATADI